MKPIVPDVLHISAVGFMHVVGIIEMIVGVAILGGFTELFGYVMCIWLLGIIANFLSMGKFLDVALRGLGLSVSAFSLAQLSTSPNRVASISGVFGRKNGEHPV